MGRGMRWELMLFQLLVVLQYSCWGQVPVNPSQGSPYETPHKRFEYKYSFKGPYLAQKDGAVPFWEYDGNAIASEEMVRITPSLRSKRGSIWSKFKTAFEWWEVEVWFRVNGRGRLGADGIAFWFTEGKTPEGPVFGSADQWRGLGVFFDSFDNDGKGNNPYIMAMTNDGTKLYDHDTDGSNQQISGCLRDFRNKPFPVRAKIEYYRNVLSVMFHSGNTNNDDEYELCLRAENVVLPQYGHFGISAATGGLADDHDAIKFLAYSLHPPGTQTMGQPVLDADKIKIDREYEDFKTKLEKQKEEYFKNHPEEAKKFKEKEEMDSEHEYESMGEKELQQIFNGQSQMYEALKTLNRKLDEILGRQERTLSMIGSVQQGTGGAGHVPTAQGGASPMQRHEVESLLTSQRELLQSSRDIRSAVMQQGNQPHQPASVQQATNPLTSQLLTEIRDGINVLRREMGTIGTKMNAGNLGQAPNHLNCPAPASCVSTSFFSIFMAIHLMAILGYLLYKSNRESAAKKFY